MDYGILLTGLSKESDIADSIIYVCLQRSYLVTKYPVNFKFTCFVYSRSNNTDCAKTSF